MFYRAWPGSSFLHVELYFLCGINGNKHTLTYTVPKEFTSSILDGFASSDSATLLLVSLAAVFSIVTQRFSPQTL